MIRSPLLEASRRTPEHPAVIDQAGVLSYRALAEAVSETASRLAALGVAPGDRVALWGANSREWVIGAHAALALGATLLPLSTRWTDREADEALSRFAPSLLLGEASLAARAAALGHPAHAWDALPPAPGISLPESHPAERPLAMMLTSGTTGRPKAATLSWSAARASAGAVAQALALSEADRWWLAMPLFHVGGLGALLRCAWHGAAVVLAGRFEPSRCLAELEATGVTIASFVPTMLQAVLEQPGETCWPRALRLIMLGGAGAPPSLLARCPLALATYGLSEAGSTVTLVPPGADAETRLTSGYPLPGYALAIRDAAGQALPAGSEGLVWVRSPALMSGYWGDAAATARALQDGWLSTGDIGRLDAAGRLTVLARREDLIVSGGENIYPAELESALSAHPAVAAAAVVGVPDARWGQTPVAWVVPRGGAPDAEALTAWLLERLARYKRPKRILFTEALPLLANGKIDRQALKHLSMAGSDPLE